MNNIAMLITDICLLALTIAVIFGAIMGYKNIRRLWDSLLSLEKSVMHLQVMHLQVRETIAKDFPETAKAMKQPVAKPTLRESKGKRDN